MGRGERSGLDKEKKIERKEDNKEKTRHRIKIPNLAPCETSESSKNFKYFVALGLSPICIKEIDKSSCECNLLVAPIISRVVVD